MWVKKWQNGEPFDERKGNEPNPLKGRSLTVFDSVEEERDYLKAQGDYLKKRYPNLVRDRDHENDITDISDGTNFHYLSVIQDLFNNEIVT
ncbi:hypothetical protein [Paenibacillus monticola]|uniref:hypothetical protein n=1 Tax=Paenibacillus monticola TaxID=2666075 RepID=UPI001E466411|nr:hypothetical protein [Paenibacillus monticola]